MVPVCFKIFRTSVSNLLKIHAEQVFNEEYVLSFSSSKMITVSREQQLRPFWASRFVRKGFARGKLIPGKCFDFVPLIQTTQNTNRHYLTLQL